MGADSHVSLEPSDGNPQDEVELRLWLEDVSGPEWIWYIKRLSANDTLLNSAHQYGPYVSKALIRLAFPQIWNQHTNVKNPETATNVSLDSHGVSRDVRVIWYNNKVVEGGTRDEARITQWGGKKAPLLDPEATGSLCVFAFALAQPKNSPQCRAWLCRGPTEADAVEDVVGPVGPGEGLLHSPSGTITLGVPTKKLPCWLTKSSIPPAWLAKFPTAMAIVELSVRTLTSAKRGAMNPDARLIARRACEFQIFLSLEQEHVLPRIMGGFATVDDFIKYANGVANRRKSRAGVSLELQAQHIFTEEKLPHERGKVTEDKKRPDFLFPSSAAYHDPKYPAAKLRMLAAKTTCKDRWRQVINEADRIPKKHLLTLQEGVSPNQWSEMSKHGVKLVVPSRLHGKYPKSVRSELLSLSEFIKQTLAISP